MIGWLLDLLKRLFPPAIVCDRGTQWCTVDHAKWEATDLIEQGTTPCNHCGRLWCCPKPKVTR